MAARPQPQVRKQASKLSAWKALTAHYKAVSKLHLRQLFADDPKRGQRMAVEALGLYLDYSKNRVTDDTLKLLRQLAAESGLRARIRSSIPERGGRAFGRRSRLKIFEPRETSAWAWSEPLSHAPNATHIWDTSSTTVQNLPVSVTA
jgi:hypothetical protein